MAFEGLSMSNMHDITCNDLFLVVNDNQIKNVYDIFALKGDVASVANTISTLDTATITKLQDLANNVTALTNFDSYVNTQLALKSNISDVYYQGTVNSILNNYYTSNTSNTLFYTKTNVDNLLATYYTKTQSSNLYVPWNEWRYTIPEIILQTN